MHPTYWLRMKWHWDGNISTWHQPCNNHIALYHFSGCSKRAINAVKFRIPRDSESAWERRIARYKSDNLAQHSELRLWFVDTVLWLCPSLPTETLKWLSSLPILMQKSFWWWQCSDTYIISLSPHRHTPFAPPPLPFSPSLLSLMVSVDVKHHVYLQLSTQRSEAVWKSRKPPWAPVPNKPTVSVDVKQHSNSSTTWAGLA